MISSVPTTTGTAMAAFRPALHDMLLQLELDAWGVSPFDPLAALDVPDDSGAADAPDRELCVGIVDVASVEGVELGAVCVCVTEAAAEAVLELLFSVGWGLPAVGASVCSNDPTISVTLPKSPGVTVCVKVSPPLVMVKVRVGILSLPAIVNGLRRSGRRKRC